MSNSMLQTDQPPRESLWIDALGLALLAALAVKVLAGFSAAVDLELADEALYLTRGVELFQTRLDPQWAPLYSVWYFLLNGLFRLHDTVQLFVLNYVALSVLGPFLLYIYLRRIRVIPLVALVAAALQMLSFSNLGMTPYQGKFAIVCVLGCLIAATYLPKRVHYGVLAITLLLLSFVRPEYALAFVLAVLVAIGLVVYQVWRQGTSILRERFLWTQAAFILVLVVVLSLFMGNPLLGGRSDSAFKQHFAVNYVSWGLADVNPWAASDAIAQQAFGEQHSLARMALNNPALFARHLLSNASLYPKNLIQTTAITPYLSGNTNHWGQLVLGGILLVVFAVCVALNVKYARSQPARRCRIPAFCDQPNRDAIRLVVALLVFTSIPALLASLLIFPRPHYLQLQALLLLILLAAFVSNSLALFQGRLRRPARTILLVAATGATLLLLAPNLAGGWWWRGEAVTPRTDVRSTVMMLRTLALQSPVRFLAYTRTLYSFNTYLGPNYVSTTGAPGNDLPAFLLDQDVNMIIWPDRIGIDDVFRDNADFAKLLDDPDSFGFAQLAVSNPTWKGTSRVLIAEALVAELPDPALVQKAPAVIAPASGASQDQYKQAEELLLAGNVDQAIDLYRSLLVSDPANRSGHMALAAALAKAGLDVEAVLEYQAISAQWPDFPWAYTRRGEILERQGDLPGAILAFEEAVRLAPDDPNPRFILAYAYRHAGMADEAIATFEAALSMDPNRSAARKVLDELKAIDRN